MKKYQVAICDQEEEYVLELSNFLNRQEELSYTVSAFTQEEALLDYLTQHPMDMLVLGEQCSLERYKEYLTMTLTEIKSKEDENADCIFKYESAVCLSVRIQERLKQMHQDWYQSHKVSVIAIYSPIGRCGKTQYALGMTRYGGEKGLYLAFEDYASLESSSDGMDECLYRIYMRKEEFASQLIELVELHEDLSVITGMSSCADIHQMQPEDYRWFVEQIRGTTVYSHIVCDISTGCLSDIRALEEFDEVYVPVLEDISAKCKLQSFHKRLEKMGKQRLAGRIRYITVPNCDYRQEEMQQCIQRNLKK